MSAPFPLFDVYRAVEGLSSYHNSPVSHVNDHVIRLSVMTAPFYWHYHPNSDESFLVMEGTLCIEMDNRTVELEVGQIFTVPAGIKHRTRPKGDRSVNVTFERAGLETVEVTGTGGIWPLGNY
jgi:mannose-6-phosphate isomerase-like protein (cupin superfamily)